MTMTNTIKTADMLKALNELHEKLDRKPFKSWKQSRDKLTNAIMKAQAEVNKMQPAKEPIAVAAEKLDSEMKELIGIANRYRNAIGKSSLTTWSGTKDELKAAIKTWKEAQHKAMSEDTSTKKIAEKVRKEKKQKKNIKPLKQAKQSKDDAILPAIARELKMEPKVARTRLRKKFGSDWKNLTAAELRAALTKKS